MYMCFIWAWFAPCFDQREVNISHRVQAVWFESLEATADDVLVFLNHSVLFCGTQVQRDPWFKFWFSGITEITQRGTC